MNRKSVRHLCATLVLTLLLGAFPLKARAAASRLIAFTFDDGPSQYTERLLDGLEQRGAVATFFMNGTNGANGLSRYSALAARMVALGCQSANHTDRHAQFPKLTAAQMRSEVSAVDKQLYLAIGAEYTTLVRIPYGYNTPQIRANVDHPMILWSVDTMDWKTLDANAVYTHIMEHAYDGAILLMHDSYASTVDGALRAIDALRKQGYELVTVSELLRRRGNEPKNGSVYLDARDNGVTLPAYSAPELKLTPFESEGVVRVSISAAESGLTFHYTTDGSQPTPDSPVCDGTLQIWSSATLRVVGYDRFLTRTPEASRAITVPTAAPLIAGYTDGRLSLSCATDGATISYTTDGADPAVSGTVYDGAFAPGDTVRAIARKEGKPDSAELTVVHTAHGSLFRDIPANAAYLAAVDDVVHRGLMSGTGGWRFSPQDAMSRAQMATALHRLAGKPDAPHTTAFSDVAEGTWYTAAVDWAVNAGILKGVGAHYFKPADALTWEQAAVALFRYARSAGLVTIQKAPDPSAFPGAAPYALEALSWCAAKGVLHRGKAALNTPIPRADWAMMLSTFCNMQK